MPRLIVVLALLVVCPAHAADWRGDLEFLFTEIERLHPNPYKSVTRDELRSSIAGLEARAGELKPYQMVAEMSRLVALIGDGHTRLTLPIDPNAGFFLGHLPTPLPADPGLRFRHLPLRFFWFDDGLFIRDASDPALIGAKVTGIGSDTVDDALQKMGPYVSADNDMQHRLLVADYLAIPEMLSASGIVADMERVEVRTENRSAILTPLAFGSPADWLDKPDPKPFSFRYLPRRRIVLFTYNEVSNDKNETLSDFAARMFRFIDEHPVEALIIDIRQNPGGNGALNRSLVHGLIRSRKLQQPGRIFVLIGRRTFSAALFFVLDLEQNTNAVFVGEPTGAIPNHFGDSRKTQLPSSGLTVRVSTLYWQKSDPRDNRRSVEPHIPVSLTSAALKRDLTLQKAIDVIGRLRIRRKPAGPVTGIATLGPERIAVTIANGHLSSKELGVEAVPIDARVGDGWMFGTFTWAGLTVPFFAVLRRLDMITWVAPLRRRSGARA